MADLAARARDGHSTAGTLGIGLGAIARLADAARRATPCPAGARCSAAQFVGRAQAPAAGLRPPG